MKRVKVRRDTLACGALFVFTRVFTRSFPRPHCFSRYGLGAEFSKIEFVSVVVLGFVPLVFLHFGSTDYLEPDAVWSVEGFCPGVFGEVLRRTRREREKPRPPLRRSILDSTDELLPLARVSSVNGFQCYTRTRTRLCPEVFEDKYGGFWRSTVSVTRSSQSSGFDWLFPVIHYIPSRQEPRSFPRQPAPLNRSLTVSLWCLSALQNSSLTVCFRMFRPTSLSTTDLEHRYS